MQVDPTMVITGLGVLVGYKVIDRIVDFFWNRTANGNYVTVEELDSRCQSCKDGESSKETIINKCLESLGKEIKDVKQMVLVMALGKPGMDDDMKDALKKLVS